MAACLAPGALAYLGLVKWASNDSQIIKIKQSDCCQIAAEGKPLRRQRNSGMITMDLKAIWEMSVEYTNLTSPSGDPSTDARLALLDKDVDHLRELLETKSSHLEQTIADAKSDIGGHYNRLFGVCLLLFALVIGAGLFFLSEMNNLTTTVQTGLSAAPSHEQPSNKPDTSADKKGKSKSNK